MHRQVTLAPRHDPCAALSRPSRCVVSATWTLVDAVLDALDASPPGTPLTLATYSAGVAALRRILRHPRRGPTTVYVDASIASRRPQAVSVLEEMGEVLLRHLHVKAAVIAETRTIISSANLGKCRGHELTLCYDDPDLAQWLLGELAAMPAGLLPSRSNAAKGAAL